MTNIEDHPQSDAYTSSSPIVSTRILFQREKGSPRLWSSTTMFEYNAF